MKGRVKDPTQKQELTCRQCHAEYHVECGEGMAVTLIPRVRSYICSAPCEAENRVGIHHMMEGATFTCGKCGKRTRVAYLMVGVDAEEVSQP